MSASIWRICFHVGYPTTDLWNRKRKYCSLDHIHQDRIVRNMYKHQLCRFHSLTCSRSQRIHIHKTFERLTTRGKCPIEWFFGFKLHLIINDKGEILNFMFTTADVDDRKLYIQLITKNKNNMKNVLMNINDKILIRKRTMIETVNDELKNIAKIEHSKTSVIQQFQS
jgi:hypothetical protein